MGVRVIPFNGSGTFTIINTFVPNTTILSAAVNQNFSDIATGLSDCLTRDGQAGMSAVFKAVSGSVSAPGISFNSDATAGLYLSSTGIVGLVAKSLGILINSAIYQVSSATVQVGGSGYAVGDTITTTGGTAINQAVLTVATLSGTAVATVTVSYGGNFTAQPSNPVSQGSTSGLGTGCTLNLTFAAQFARSVATDESGNSVWQRLGASSFVSGLMAFANGLDFVNGIGAANIAAGLGLSAPPPGSSFKNLSIKVATNTTVTAAADFVVTTNGTKYQTTALSSTINLGTTGANALDAGTIAIDTWYAIWTIAKSDGTTAGLASTSFSSPTMPTGYTYKSRIGAVKTAHGSAILLGSYQFGRRAQWVVGVGGLTVPLLVASGAQGSITVPTWVSFTMNGGNVQASYVPSTASRVMGYLLSTTGASAMVAPSNQYGPISSTTTPPPVSYNGGGAGSISLQFEFLLESSAILYAAQNGAELLVTGWEDSL